MNYIVSGRNIEITEALREKIVKKLGKLEKFLGQSAEIHATLGTEKNTHILDVTINSNGSVFRAEEKSEDMYACIDNIVDTLESQIVKNKSKFDKKHKESPKHTVESFTHHDNHKVKITEYSRYSIKPMTLEEALMQINVEKLDFFMFSNSDTKAVNALIKLKNGNFELVEPDI